MKVVSRIMLAIVMAGNTVPLCTSRITLDFSHFTTATVTTATSTTIRRSNNKKKNKSQLRYPSFLRRVQHQHRYLEFGDYVDPTHSCPPMTTCPMVCVASFHDCPEDALCPGTHPETNADTNPDHEYEVSEVTR